MKRNNIVTAIIEEQQKIIANLNQSVNRYKVASDLDEESTHDPEDFSHQTEAKDMQLRYEKMLREAELDLVSLEKEINTDHTEIEDGSIIETEDAIYFIGISVPAFELEKKEIISFSADAPIFEKMKDKKVGDKVEIGPNTAKIISIY